VRIVGVKLIPCIVDSSKIHFFFGSVPSILVNYLLDLNPLPVHALADFPSADFVRIMLNFTLMNLMPP